MYLHIFFLLHLSLSVLFYFYLCVCGPFLLWSLHAFSESEHATGSRPSPPKISSQPFFWKQHDMTKSRSSPDIHQQRGCTGRGWNELPSSEGRTRWADVGWRAHGWKKPTPWEKHHGVPWHLENAVKTSRIRLLGVSNQEGRNKVLPPWIVEYLWNRLGTWKWKPRRHMGVSKNRGTPKWIWFIMENPIKMI